MIFHLPDVPEMFKPFANLDHYVSKKKAKQRLSVNELRGLVECLSGNLAKVISEIYIIIKQVEACKAIVIHLDTKLASSTNRNALTELVRTPKSHSLITKISPASTVKQNYGKVGQNITEVAFYEPIQLLEFQPMDRYSRRQWIDSLQLSHSICLYRMPYGGTFGTVNFIWKLP